MLGRTSIGVAVRDGAPLPDIATPEAFKALLLSVANDCRFRRCGRRNGSALSAATVRADGNSRNAGAETGALRWRRRCHRARRARRSRDRNHLHQRDACSFRCDCCRPAAAIFTATTPTYCAGVMTATVGAAESHVAFVASLNGTARARIWSRGEVCHMPPAAIRPLLSAGRHASRAVCTKNGRTKPDPGLRPRTHMTLDRGAPAIHRRRCAR